MSHLSMQGRWNMWRHRGKHRTVSPSWKSWNCTSQAESSLMSSLWFIALLILSISRPKAKAPTYKTNEIYLKAHWTRDFLPRRIDIIIISNRNFGYLFNRISRQTSCPVAPGVKNILKLLKSWLHSTHLNQIRWHNEYGCHYPRASNLISYR